MGSITSFTFTTLNGFYKGQQEEISWHKHGAEESAFSAGNLQSRNTLIFGRVTYEMMASYWPSPMAAEQNPVVARGMNEAEKIVFSTTLEHVNWNNTIRYNGNLVETLSTLKQQAGKNMTILGSGTIVTQLAEAGLIDEYQIMIDPVVIGKGTPLFHGLDRQLDLELVRQQTFKSGVVLHVYRPL